MEHDRTADKIAELRVELHALDKQVARVSDRLEAHKVSTAEKLAATVREQEHLIKQVWKNSEWRLIVEGAVLATAFIMGWLVDIADFWRSL